MDGTQVPDHWLWSPPLGDEPALRCMSGTDRDRMSEMSDWYNWALVASICRRVSLSRPSSN